MGLLHRRRPSARRRAAVAGAALALSSAVALSAEGASALEVQLRDSFAFPRAASLAWDPWLCGLWVAVEGPQLFLLAPGGQEIRRLEPDLSPVRSLTVEEGGLLVADGWGRVQRITREGGARAPAFRLGEGLRDTEGLQIEPGGTLLLVEDDPARLIRLSEGGARLMELRGETVATPMMEPQGVARDPLSGNILVVDDNEGLNAIFEFAPDLELLSVTPLSDYGRDAEGIAVHAQTGTLYVGFDSGRRIAVFDYLPTRAAASAPFDQGPDCPIS